ncbi:MAG: OpgC domain-containing protein, partial [Promethearchaeota archaeon]
DMILVHYCPYFPRIISKIISYHDVAIEGFILLAGFMIGKHYLPHFLVNQTLVAKKMYIRVLKILLIQYIMIITISFPQYLILNENFNIETSSRFLFESFVFYNQIGLIHILPTFIPLFLISPIILLLLSKKADYIVLLGSLFFFVIGQTNPYVFNYGDKTIFPVILWQIYFIVGCYFGKISLLKKRSIPNNVILWFFIACLFLLIAIFFKHSTSLSVWLTAFKNDHSIIIMKFPLNFYGLFYGTSLLFFIYAFSAKFWHFVRKTDFVYFISSFGRHSLLVFIIHIYFAIAISVIRRQFDINIILIYFMIFINIAFTYSIIKRHEYDLLVVKDRLSNKIIRWI